VTISKRTALPSAYFLEVTKRGFQPNLTHVSCMQRNYASKMLAYNLMQALLLAVCAFHKI